MISPRIKTKSDREYVRLALAQDSRLPHCANCAGSINRCAIGKRVYGERVYVCSPSCLWALYKIWAPSVVKKPATLWGKIPAKLFAVLSGAIMAVLYL